MKKKNTNVELNFGNIVSHQKKSVFMQFQQSTINGILILTTKSENSIQIFLTI